MSTLDELERSVERLNRAVERLSGGMGKYGFANVYNDDVQLLLSERAELLAAVERMREIMSRLVALPEAERQFAYLDKGIGTKTQNGVWLEARAALTTGEEK